jgi:DNA polymerase-3 subunit delta
MLFLFYGEESFLSRKKIREIVKEYQKVRQGGLNLIYLDFKKDVFGDFLEKTESLPLFASKRLIVLENVFSDQELCEKFLKYFKDKSTPLEQTAILPKNTNILIEPVLEQTAPTGSTTLKDTVLIFFELGTPRSDNHFFTFLRKSAKTQEFKPLPPQDLILWVKKEVEDLGGKITILATNKLIAVLGNDLWALESEIKKLVAFKNDQAIEDNDLVFLTGPGPETSIFRTIDAIADNNKKAALGLLSQHWQQGDPPIYLLAMISYQFRNLLLVKDLLEKKRPFLAMVKTTGLNPFVVKKCLSQVKKFSFLRLKQIYSQLLETDLQIKTGKVDPRRGLEFFVLTI